MTLKNTLESSDKVIYDLYLQGINEETVKQISAQQEEPEWMLEHRLKSLKIFNAMPFPKWGPNLADLHLDDIVYYAKPSQENE
ncbi:MAG: hypothetical protein WCJ39_05400 [bacterium]